MFLNKGKNCNFFSDYNNWVTVFNNHICRNFYFSYFGSETDQRSVAMAEVFAPMVAGFAEYKAKGYNGSMFSQGTELDAISRRNLTMSIASAQELAQFFPEFSIFATGYVHQDAAHQVRVFNDPLMDPFKKKLKMN